MGMYKETIPLWVLNKQDYYIYEYENLPPILLDILEEHQLPTDDISYIQVVKKLIKYVPNWLEVPNFGSLHVEKIELKEGGFDIYVGYHS